MADKNKERNKDRLANRLAHETSTYLIQHAYNPVDWYPWGEEAIQRAKQEDKPILLSIGYSACHWCHVMEHESFEDDEIAAMMNQYFINIKVDREERPDLDDIYMKSVQMMTGQGGWPMTVFLTPELKPFYAGTYFPPFDRHGLPGFRKVLAGIENAWREQRTEIEESSSAITQHLSLADQLGKSEATIDQVFEPALEKLSKVFDQQWGGFGNAPKFPHAATLSFIMRFAQHGEQAADYMQMVNTTLNKMAQGGIHDQLGGGFSRYSVDRYWLVPHFEKMLYDNALICCNYLEGYKLTKNTYWRSVADDCLKFVKRELMTDEGAFYSSLDADSEGEEGKYYTWSQHEIINTLGREEGTWFNEVFGVTERGNFEHNTNVLHLTAIPSVLAEKYGMSEAEFFNRLEPLKMKLLGQRNKRIRPGRDEKVLTSWNSLMITAFVEGYAVLQDADYLRIAKKATNFILDKLMVNGRLLRTWGAGKAKLNGYLDDYAYFVQALLDLSAVDCTKNWLEKAIELTETMLAHFSDNENDGFFYTSNDHEKLITRTKSFFDSSTPSASAIAALNLLRLSQILGNKKYESIALKTLSAYTAYFAKIPDQFSAMLIALHLHKNPGAEIAVIKGKDDNLEPVVFSIFENYLPNSTVVVHNPKEGALSSSPLLQNRTAISGLPTVYICRNYTCDSPVTDITELKTKLKKLSSN